jgi:hypothetical protein
LDACLAVEAFDRLDGVAALNTWITGGSLLQGSFPSKGDTGRNLEAVILRPRDGGLFDLQHYWLDEGKLDQTWNAGAVITSAATGPGAICQRKDDGGRLGNFEVIVPEVRGLAHHWLDNTSAGARPWNFAGIAMPGPTGPGTILENRLNGNLEAVVIAGRELIHCWFDNIVWRQGAKITSDATGAPAMIQSDYDGHLEVVVAEGPDLVLYWLDWGGPQPTWKPGGLITDGGDGPAGFVQGRYGADPHRNFEVVVPRGDALAVYWRDNTRAEMPPWRGGGVATWGAAPIVAAALVSSSLGDGWLQALIQEGASIYHVYRYGLPSGGLRWMRRACVRLGDTMPADVDVANPRSVKLAQVTGQPDAQTGGATLSQSRSVSGIHGTDLGVTVHHGQRTFLLFGDTHWDIQDRVTLDSIGEVVPRPDGLPHVEMHGSPLTIVPPVNQREYDVPLDAFSAGGQFFAFFTSDHFTDGKVMGSSVLTRALDPSMPVNGLVRDHDLRFQLLTTFSAYRFINVSVQLVPAASVPGFGQTGHVLLVWGSGAYRADDLRLAVIDLHDPATWTYLLDDQPFPVDVLGVRYFTGMCGSAPLWSFHEEGARPVLFPCALGELSVRWVPQINRYLLLAMSGPEDPIGSAVWLRTARNPWGPWSRRRQVFDWLLDGLGRRIPHPPQPTQFIHDRDAIPPDHVGDCIFDLQCQGGGAGYAPYLFDVAVHGEVITLRYTLSTWNPYQVQLLRHDATLSEFRALEQ